MKTNPDHNAFQEGAFGPDNSLTKREYFAALALQGCMTNPDGLDETSLARIAVDAADALIEALNK